MFRISSVILLLLIAPASAQISALTVVPTHPTPGLQLNWTGSGGVTVRRWTDANPTPIVIGTSPGGSYTDTAVSANTVYYYNVAQGSSFSNTFPGIVSDITLPFNCPPMVPVAPSLLGVNRTVLFQSANGSEVSFTINAPVAKPTVVNVSPAGVGSDWANINNAITTVQSSGGGTVQLAAGDYHLSNPAWMSGQFNTNIFFNGSTDIVFAGAGSGVGGTHLYFNIGSGGVIPAGMVFGSSNRILVENLSIDWDFPNAIPGVVNNVVDATFSGAISGTVLTATSVSGTILVGGTLFDSSGGTQITGFTRITSQVTGPTGGAGTYNLTAPMSVSTPETMTSVSTQRFNVQNGSYYIPTPTSPPTAVHLDGYHLTNKAYNLLAGARIAINPGAFNPNFPMDGLYYWVLSGGTNLPDGTEGVFFVKTGHAIDVGVAADNTSFENVSVYGGGSTGIILSKDGGNMRLSNFTITRKPDALLAPGELPRYVSLIGDSESNQSYGNILIENSEMGYVDDDSFYNRGYSGPTASVADASHFTATVPFQFSPNPSGDAFSLIDPNTYALIGSSPGTLTQVNIGGGNWTWTVTLLNPISGLASYVGASSSNLPVMGIPSQSGTNFVVKNSCFHDTHGRVFPKTANGLITGNTFGNSYLGPIELSLDVTAPGIDLTDGPGPSNIIISNNKIVSSGSGVTDLSTIWAPLTVSAGYQQTGWAQGAINIYGIAGTGFSPTGYPYNALQIYGNFISSAVGLCISVIGANNVGVVGNDLVDCNSVPFTSGFNATYCGTNSQGSQPAGANQPWCFAKVAAQGALMISHSKNVDATSTANTCLGTTASPCIFTDTPTVTKDNIVGSRLIH
jgi:hypothetical protein